MTCTREEKSKHIEGTDIRRTDYGTLENMRRQKVTMRASQGKHGHIEEGSSHEGHLLGGGRWGVYCKGSRDENWKAATDASLAGGGKKAKG